MPISSRTASSGTMRRSAQATPMPTTAPGSITFTFHGPNRGDTTDRNRVLHHQDRQQDRQRLSGGMMSASSGVAAMPTPENPPLARPSSSTARKARARKRGSVEHRAGTRKSADLEQDAWALASLTHAWPRCHRALLNGTCMAQDTHELGRDAAETGERWMDARTSRYHEVYARAHARPGRLLGRGRAGHRLVRAGEKRVRHGGRHLRPLVHRRHPATPATTRSTAMWSAGAPTSPRSSTTPPSPTQARHHLWRTAARGRDARRDPAGFRRHERRPRHPLYADGAGGAVRHARLRAHRRDPLAWCSAALRPKELATRIDDAKPKLILSASLRHRGRRASSRTSRCSTRRSILPRTSRSLHRAAAPASEAALIAGRDHDWASAARRSVRRARKPRLRAGARDRPALHPLHLGHDRHSEGRRARQWRPPGRAQMVDARTLRHRSRARPGGAPPTSAGSSAIPTSSMRRCFTARPRSSTRASRSARRTPARSGASSPNTARSRCSPRRPRSARSRRKTRTATSSRKYDLSNFRTLFLAGERADPPTVEWAEQLLKVPVIDHWWQTETGWGIAGNPMGLGMLPVKHGSPTVPMPGYDVRSRRRGLQAGAAPARWARSSSSCRCRPPACRRCGSTTSACARAISPNSPATTKPPTPATRTTDGYLFIMGRTDDIINVAGHRLSTGGMEEVLAGIRTSPNARSSASRTR